MRSFLGVPLHLGGDVIGRLYVTESARGAFDDEDEQLALGFAAAASVAIGNARLNAALRERSQVATLAAGQLRATLDALERGVCMTDADGTILLANERLSELLGLHPAAVEDSREWEQLPRLDDYDDHALLIFFTAREIDGQVEPVEVHMYISGSWILTIRRCETTLDAQRGWIAGHDCDEDPDQVQPAGGRVPDVLTPGRVPVGADRDHARQRGAVGANRGQEPPGGVAAVVLEGDRRHRQEHVVGEQRHQGGDVSGFVGAGEPGGQLVLVGGHPRALPRRPS
jgi:PAS domain-containing protein